MAEKIKPIPENPQLGATYLDGETRKLYTYYPEGWRYIRTVSEAEAHHILTDMIAIEQEEKKGEE